MSEELLTDTAERGPWMQTVSGRRFHLLDPRAEDVRIADIAHALGMLCRYNGHSPRFYSVAEHCCHCAFEARRRGASPAEQLAVLLHDAAEAYTGDLISPMKAALRDLMYGGGGMCDFDAIEEGAQDAIWQAFFLDQLGPDLMLADRIRSIDLAVGAAECAAFGIAVTPGREQDAAPGFEPRFWSPGRARRNFMHVFCGISASLDSRISPSIGVGTQPAAEVQS